jgi:hypothetical protein
VLPVISKVNGAKTETLTIVAITSRHNTVVNSRPIPMSKEFFNTTGQVVSK